MKYSILVIAFLLAIPMVGHAAPTLEDLQGAWWSEHVSPTAAFAISGEKVWVDITSRYHPCRIEGDMLIFEIGEGIGKSRRRIISLEGDELILENPKTGKRNVLHRDNPP